MTDVFVSYERSNEVRSMQIADQLRQLGYEVWRDDQLPAHRAYADVIAERLKAAKAVVVVWSAEAAKSLWVRAEAEIARNAGTLVQLRLDGAALPLPFNQIQCVDLSGWHGEPADLAWQRVVESIQELTGQAISEVTRPIESVTPTPAQPVLAVLAFENLSGDPEMVFFSDGVSEEIQQTVARGTQLKVIGRTSCFQFRGQNKSVRRVSAELNATHILDGSVRRSGSRVRITAQLIDCSNGISLWSSRFDRELTDIFALQDEIAAAVAAALKIAFAPTSPVGPIGPVAYDHYLQAMNIGVGRTDGSSTRIPRITLFEKVVAEAPKFAPAWAGLAMSRALQLRLAPQELPYSLMRSRVVEAAETALRLDPGSGLAYSALAWLEPKSSFTQREALELKALSESPNDPWILFNVGQFYAQVGRFEQGLRYLQQAHDLDPLHVTPAIWYAGLTGIAGRADQSDALFDVFLDRWPESPGLCVAALFVPTTRPDWPRWDHLAERYKTLGAAESGEATVSAVLGMGVLRSPTAAIRAYVLSQMQAEVVRTGTLPVAMLVFAHRLGLKEEVFELADKASFASVFDPQAVFESGGLLPVIHLSIPANKSMMPDPRFVTICHRLGLCDYWVTQDVWPDCTDFISQYYDFKAEACRLVAET